MDGTNNITMAVDAEVLIKVFLKLLNNEGLINKIPYIKGFFENLWSKTIILITSIKDFFYKFDSSRYPAPVVDENKSILTFGYGRIVAKKNSSEEQNYSYSLALEQFNKDKNDWEHQSQVVSTRIQSVTFEQDGNIVRVDIKYNDSHGNERTYSFLLIKRSANTTTEPTG